MRLAHRTALLLLLWGFFMFDAGKTDDGLALAGLAFIISGSVIWLMVDEKGGDK